LIAGCADKNRYVEFYRASYDKVNDENAFMIDHSGEPRVIYTRQFEYDLKLFTDDDFVVVGKSIFASPPEDIEKAVKLGKELKITHVLLSTDYVYSGSKKAYKFAETRQIYPVYQVVNGIPIRGFESMPDHVAIPYRKEVPIFKQQAAFLGKGAGFINGKKEKSRDCQVG